MSAGTGGRGQPGAGISADAEDGIVVRVGKSRPVVPRDQMSGKYPRSRSHTGSLLIG